MAALRIAESDAVEILASLGPGDLVRRVRAEMTREWMLVFVTDVVGVALYIKVLLRVTCLVISFHEAQDEAEKELD